MELSLKQTEALDYLEDKVTNELLFGGGAGGGKSALGCYFQLKQRMRYPQTRGLIGRASLKTIKETTLVTAFEIAHMQGLRSGQHYKYNGQSNQIEFKNGSVILLKDLFAYPSDPNFDELGSLEITDAFIDEANQTVEKAKNIVKSRIRYKLDVYNLIPKTMYGCNPAKNWTYSEFYKPNKEGKLPSNKKFIQSLIDDNPYISKHYRENLLGLDKNSIERLLRGNWEYDDDPAALIAYERILDCFTNSFIPAGEGFITADIARFGSDKIVIGVWKGWRVKLYHYAKLSITETAELIKKFANTNNIPMSRVIADEDGVGGGVVDILGCQGFVNNSVALDNPLTGEKENYNNLKSQCYYLLAKLINEAGLFIEEVDIETREQIVEELEQVKQFNMDKDGKKQIMPKDKVKELIGRSPDFSDTLMMRMWFNLAFQFRPVAG